MDTKQSRITKEHNRITFILYKIEFNNEQINYPLCQSDIISTTVTKQNS